MVRQLLDLPAGGVGFDAVVSAGEFAEVGDVGGAFWPGSGVVEVEAAAEGFGPGVGVGGFGEVDLFGEVGGDLVAVGGGAAGVVGVVVEVDDGVQGDVVVAEQVGEHACGGGSEVFDPRNTSDTGGTCDVTALECFGGGVDVEDGFAAAGVAALQ